MINLRFGQKEGKKKLDRNARECLEKIITPGIKSQSAEIKGVFLMTSVQ